MQLGKRPVQESELRCPREEGPKSDGDRSVRGTSIGFNLGFNRGVAAFQCALIEPFLFVAQCQAAGFRAARPRPAGPLLGKPPRLPPSLARRFAWHSGHSFT